MKGLNLPVDVFVRLLGDHTKDADQVYEHNGYHVSGEIRVIEVRVLLRYVHEGGDQLEDDDGGE